MSDSLRSLSQKVRTWFNKHQTIRTFATNIAILSGLYTLRTVFCICYYKYYRYPPCVSFGFPILGCMPLYGRDPHKFASYIVCNDGQLPLSTVPIGLQNVIFVNDNKTAKKILKSNEIGLMRHLNANKFQLSSFLMINGRHKWLHQRKFLFSTFGVISRSSFTYLSIKHLFETDFFPNYIDEAILNHNGKFDIFAYCDFVSFYAIFTAIFGNHLDDLQTMDCYFYRQYKSLIRQKETSFWLYVAYETIINITIPQIIFERLFGIKKVHQQLIKHLKYYLSKHEIVRVSNYGKTTEWNKEIKNKSAMLNKILINDMDIEQIAMDVYALLGAGMETTAKHIEFGLVMLCKYPKLERKIYNELAQYDKYKPSLLQNELHFLRAFVHEILRFGVILPFGLPHKCVNDVDINGYTIYKGSTVIINHLSMHYHQKNGSKFNINRWLDKDRKFNRNKMKSFLVFGYCNNCCVGKGIAMQIMYAVFALLISKYVIYNHNLPQNIKRTWGINRGIHPVIPIYFKHRTTT